MVPLKLGSALGCLLAALAWALSCSTADRDPTGGETHFLTRCDAASECGDALSCVCGLCTLPCSNPTDCASLPSAECTGIAQSSVCSEPSASLCDVRCTSDADCLEVSSALGCTQGVCRSQPDAGDGAAGAGGGAGCSSGDVAGNQVLVIGDSFFGATHQVTAYLEDLARTSGALGVGERYRDESAVSGNTLALGSRGIEAQYATAIEEAPVAVVIMDGGGSDILVGSCDVPDADCPLLVDANQAATDLLSQMAGDGVQDVVYLFYPDYDDAGIRDEVDALRPLIEATCAESAAPCHFVDLRPAFSGHVTEYTDASGVLPSALGAEAAAQAIWSAMQDSCIAQ